ncbi:FtsX-like permease family protein [Bacillus dakarensis]|uniref:FtsX-like permease family protein n=1 Tax=Robertmurraya dakarensis TaxID=1926278 RepID=UPI000980D9F8|nr:ABC transporter permease [Bacillus dakarensis]
MRVSELILRNLKKNLKNYYLYVFALIFSTGLYFAFVTLQYDPALDQVEGTVKGEASIRAASILLVAIVSIFLLYANNIFIKRRGKEIGLFQLIGMTKGRIFRILTAENFLIYFASLCIGIFIGFSMSRLILMILFRITQVETEADLRFSSEAFLQTFVVFSIIFGLIMLMNYFFIKRQSILSLFRVVSTTESKMKNLSLWEMFIGLIGILLIIVGYFVSSKLFSGDITSVTNLFLAMVFILGSVIIGTYLFYKGSVSFVFHLIRKQKKGYLNVQEVLSLSTIMFRMRSNALLLTIITTVSALSIGLLSLSYIAYYSAEAKARNYVAADFSINTREDAEMFTQALDKHQVGYRTTTIDVIQAEGNIEQIIGNKMEGMNFDPTIMSLAVISDSAITELDLSKDEVLLTGYNDLLQKFMGLKNTGTIELIGKNKRVPLTYLGIEKEYYISGYFTNGGTPVAVVDDEIFEALMDDIDPSLQRESSVFIGIDLKDDEEIAEADGIFQELGLSKNRLHDSRFEISNNEKKNMGLIMFIVGFLGLTFLITSGCILYFKQMGESEEERPNYNILRKLGFSQSDLLKGIKAKQIFNFGIPLGIGLLHSYFAVQSGWFLFGTEIWTPMLIVMALYTVLYSIFGCLSVIYYKKVINEAL